MRSFFLVVLSLLLATAVLAPAAITLLNTDKKTDVTIDFNEEEKEEDKKETSENDFLLVLNSNLVAIQAIEKKEIPSTYIAIDYHSSLAIFLPPPKYVS